MAAKKKFNPKPNRASSKSEIIDRQPPDLEKDDYFADVTFEGLTIESGDYSDKEFVGCTFRDCKLQKSQWTKARLEDCRFENCDLLQMVPDRLSLCGVTFIKSRLMGVDWSRIGKMPDLRFEHCNLRYCSFVGMPLRKTSFLNCDARESSFIDVDLRESDFSETDLQDSTIEGCILELANFASAINFAFNPQANRIKGLRINFDTARMIVEALGVVVG